jgi:hypothetical protein
MFLRRKYWVLLEMLFLGPGFSDTSARPHIHNAPTTQPTSCSPVWPTRRTHPCTLADVWLNSKQSAPPSAVNWACQWLKQISRKWQRSSAPTSATGPMSSGGLPRAPFGCPHSRTRIGACPCCSPCCCLLAPCCYSSAPCCSLAPCYAPTSARLATSHETLTTWKTCCNIRLNTEETYPCNLCV